MGKKGFDKQTSKKKKVANMLIFTLLYMSPYLCNNNLFLINSLCQLLNRFDELMLMLHIIVCILKNVFLFMCLVTVVCKCFQLYLKYVSK